MMGPQATRSWVRSPRLVETPNMVFTCLRSRGVEAEGLDSRDLDVLSFRER